MSQYGDFGPLNNAWYETTSKEEPKVLAEQITDRLIILRRNVVKTEVDNEVFYHYEERIIGVEQWEAYQDIWDNATLIKQTDNGLMETYEQTTTNTTDIENCNNALIELYEMISEV